MTGKYQNPCIIATGFSTAFLGDERTLREFMIGDHTKNDLLQQGLNAVLYLINDSYDALSFRQLRVGVNKDEELLRRFRKFCGRPIAEVPDPFDCCESYSRHFAKALCDRLHKLEIYPVLIDTYNSYQNGHYNEFVARTFDNYARIKKSLSEQFDSYAIKKLFHAQCPECYRLDATRIQSVTGKNIDIECERCDVRFARSSGEIRGKLGWKLDCAARWNHYRIDIEPFSKSHLAKLGSFEISSFISQEFFGGRIPEAIPYGSVRLSPELSNRLLEILPPRIFKALFISTIKRDLKLNRDYVMQFCSNYVVEPGLSYVDYVQQRLPVESISGMSSPNSKGRDIDIDTLIGYGNQFSRFYFDKDYHLSLPENETVISATPGMARRARDVIDYALSLRNVDKADHKYIQIRIESYLQEQPSSRPLKVYMRRLMGIAKGPAVSKLLTVVPPEFMKQLRLILDHYNAKHERLLDVSGVWPKQDDDGTRYGQPAATGNAATGKQEEYSNV